MYTSFYNFRAKPFENTPDPEFLFLSKQHREVLSSLIYGVDSSKGFILVAGDVGTGKTTLIRTFMQEVDPSYIVVNIINPQTSFDDIFQNLSQKLELSSKGINRIDSIESMRQKLEMLNRDGRRVVILIDEAHLLSEESLEEIRLLSNIENEKVKLVQVVLVGQNEIYTLLDRDNLRSLKQRIVVNRCLAPLNHDETQKYIEHRLEVAGLSGKLFDKGAYSLIWQKSGGVPRLINQICDNALLIGYALEKERIDKKVIKEVLDDMGPSSTTRWSFSLNWQPRNLAVGSALLLVVLIFVVKFVNDQAGEAQSSVVDLVVAEAHADLEGTNVPAVIPMAKDFLADSLDISESARLSISSVGAAESNSPALLMEENASSLEKIEGYEESVILSHAGMKPISRTITEDRYEADTIQEIKPAERLSSLARKKYGTSSDTIIDLILMANVEIQNMHHIFAGQNIVLPEITRTSLVIKGEGHNYHIHYSSFYRFQTAQQVAQDLVTAGYEAFVAPAIQGEHTVFRVYIGIFSDQRSAEESSNSITFKYLPFLNKTRV